MNRDIDADTTVRTAAWKSLGQRILLSVKRWIPFASGVVAALLGLVIYSALKPPDRPLTVEQVNTAVVEAMASATPAPAYSTQVYAIIQPSLVLIQTNRIAEDGTESQGLGSGVLISTRGEILTAFHVVENAVDIEVTFADGTQATGQIAATQPQNDIAVLQCDQLPEIAIPAVLGNASTLRVGDEAYAVGNPFGLYGSLTEGVISGLNRTFTTADSDQVIEGMIQIDAAVNPGNSGGPLLNRYGQVMGIVVGVLNPTDQDFFVGVGFAVPITTAAGATGIGGRGPEY